MIWGPRWYMGVRAVRDVGTGGTWGVPKALLSVRDNLMWLKAQPTVFQCKVCRPAHIMISCQVIVLWDISTLVCFVRESSFVFSTSERNVQAVCTQSIQILGYVSQTVRLKEREYAGRHMERSLGSLKDSLASQIGR